MPPNPLWAWIVGGNTLARIGVVLLFIGVGFLLKYAVEHVQVPISLRLAGIALGGVALLVIGWRLRGAATAYAMVLQGGGVGVLYLTVFGALRLYALVSPLAAFGLLVCDRARCPRSSRCARTPFRWRRSPSPAASSRRSSRRATPATT